MFLKIFLTFLVVKTLEKLTKPLSILHTVNYLIKIGRFRINVLQKHVY